MAILERRILGDRAVETARRDDRDLRLQRHELLDQDLAALERRPDALDLVRPRDLVLPFAVVAERRRS